MNPYLNYPVVFKFLIWIGVTAIGYIMAKISLAICIVPKQLLPIAQEFVLLEDGNEFDISHDNKTDIEWVTNILLTIKLAMCQFYFSDIMNRIDYNDPYQFIYIGLMITTIYMFGFMCQVKGMQTSCSPNSIKNWPLISKIVYGCVTIILIAGLSYEINLAYQDKTIVFYLLSLLVIAIFYIIMYCIFLRKNTIIHIHHWFIGYMLCYYFRHNTIVSNVFFSILYSIFLQGSVSFGLIPIYKN